MKSRMTFGFLEMFESDGLKGVMCASGFCRFRFRMGCLIDANRACAEPESWFGFGIRVRFDDVII